MADDQNMKSLLRYPKNEEEILLGPLEGHYPRQ